MSPGDLFSAAPAPRQDPQEDPLGDCILAYSNSSALTPEERRLRNLLLTQLRDAILAVAQPDDPARVQLEVYGSSANGFEETSSDVDCGVIVPEEDLARIFGEHKSIDELHTDLLRSVLRKCTLSGWEKVMFVSEARIPLLSIQKSGMDFDLTCTLLPIHNTRLLREYSRCHPYTRPLVVAVKKSARLAGMSGVVEGGWISSYSWTLLVIYFLQCRGLLPSLQALARNKRAHYVDSGPLLHNVKFCTAEEALAKWEPDPAPSLGEVFRDFFSFYGNEYNWEEEVVSVRLGRENSRVEESELFECRFTNPGKTPRIHIEDPFELQRNLNFALTTARHAFLAHEFRNAEMALKGASTWPLEPASSADVSSSPYLGATKRAPSGKKAPPRKKKLSPASGKLPPLLSRLSSPSAF